MSEKKIKVIDRRMFTPDGQLREEYQDSVNPDASVAPDRRPVESTGRETKAAPGPATLQAPQQPVSPPTRAAAPDPPATPASLGQPPAPTSEENAEGPRFTDLVAFMAQTAAAYLQQARASALGAAAGPESSSEMLQMAKLHVDLLAVLERKSAGNLTAEERDMLTDVQRQLRIALQ